MSILLHNMFALISYATCEWPEMHSFQSSYVLFCSTAVQCPNNQIHKECGSMCQKTCQSNAANCDDHACIDGCFCPDGMVLLNDTCVDQSVCPCTLNGKQYKNGDVVPKECNKW